MDSEVSSFRTKKDVVHQGKWLAFCNIDFKVGEKEIKNYESVERVTRKSQLDFDGLTIIPLIVSEKNKTSKLLLNAQYRPAVDKFILEFPAGLAEGKDLVEDVRRELLEETGYTLKELKQFFEKNPLIYDTPSCLYQISKVVVATIDADDPVNANPKQQLESEENIRNYLIDYDIDFGRRLQELAEKNNYGINSKLWYLALGLHVNRLQE